jgi:hypothetical protein
MDDDSELEHILTMPANVDTRRHIRNLLNKPPDVAAPVPTNDQSAAVRLEKLVQWTTADAKRFLPASSTATTLTPGLYDISQNPVQGVYFERIPVKTEGILRFPHTSSDKVLDEIEMFWKKGARFERYSLPHKRGIMLWGPPGSGKSCTIQLVMADVIARGGIGIRFNHPALFSAGFRIFREIQPPTPVVILMEDLDSIVEAFNESEVLNILDGTESMERVIFLASTNYPERLGPRIINRPSRFDRRYKIGHPTPESRRIYLEHLMSLGGDSNEPLVELEKWVAETEGFSFAHLKELFVAVVILEDPYQQVLVTLRKMREHISSGSDREGIGLGLLRSAGAMAVEAGPMSPGTGRISRGWTSLYHDSKA